LREEYLQFASYWAVSLDSLKPTEVTKYVIDREFRRLLLHIRVDRFINKLKNHTIVCGYGRNSRQAYQTLIENGVSCASRLSARVKSVKIKTISRASEYVSERKLRHAGVDNRIMLDKLGGMRKAQLVLKSDVVEFIDILLVQPSVEAHIEEIQCSMLPTSYIGQITNKLNVWKNLGCNIVSFKTSRSEYIFNHPLILRYNCCQSYLY
jgi:voltage-gated potassium channel